ncbi:hypothetical protein D3C81_1560650 [compost metagenome]
MAAPDWAASFTFLLVSAVLLLAIAVDSENLAISVKLAVVSSATAALSTVPAAISLIVLDTPCRDAVVFPVTSLSFSLEV